MGKKKYVIAVCRNGLCNRLGAVCWAYQYSLLTGRKMLLCWIPDLHCEAEFEDIYSNQIDHIDIFDFINNPPSENIEVSADMEMLKRLSSKTKDVNKPRHIPYQLLELAKKYKTVEHLSLDTNSNADYVILDKLGMKNIGKEQDLLGEFFKWLKPTEEIYKKIQTHKSRLKIDSSVFGGTIRATDFSCRAGSYRLKMQEYHRIIKREIKKDKRARIFVASDEREAELKFMEKYPNNVFSRDKTKYVEKLRENKRWCVSMRRSTESIKEAVIDMYLLAHTNYILFDKSSSFCKTIIRIKKYGQESGK